MSRVVSIKKRDIIARRCLVSDPKVFLCDKEKRGYDTPVPSRAPIDNLAQAPTGCKG